MVEKTSNKKNITEAAADVLAASIARSRPSAEQFGLGKSLNPEGVKDPITPLGGTHYRGDQPFVDFTKGVPTATPPGQTPPVGAEPMKTLEKDRGEEHATLQKTLGFGDNKDPQEVPNPDLEAFSKREGNKPDTVTPGKGNILPPWAHEALQVIVDKILSETKEDFGTDVNAIFEGQTLSDEFKGKASTVFEAAVTARINEVVVQLSEVVSTKVDETIEEIKTELTEQVDDYLNYMVEEWIKENEIAIEHGLRAEIVEDFIAGLRNLFIENYIDIPEEKVDVVEELSAKVAELEEALSTQLNNNVEMHKQLGESAKVEILRAACEGLTQTQTDKVLALAESVEFTDPQEFGEKVEMLRESYFPTSKVKNPGNNMLMSEDIEVPEDNSGSHVDNAVAQVAGFLTRSLKDSK